VTENPHQRRSASVMKVPQYQWSRAALGDAPETAQVARSLEALAAARPFAAPVQPGTLVRVIKTLPYGPYPALRLFYSVDAHAVNLLWIERYDAIEGGAELRIEN